MKRIVVQPPLSTSIRPADPTIIVLHATAGSTARSSIDHLRSIGLSYHFIIARDGKDSASTIKSDGTEPIVFQLAEPKFRVSHAGSTIPMPGGHSANRIGVGISLANRQNGEDYTAKQLATLDEVIAYVLQQLPTIRHLTTHAVIQPWDRADPKNIDARALAKKHGLTWFEPTPNQIKDHTPKKTKLPKTPVKS